MQQTIRTMHAELSEHNQPHLLVAMRVDLILHISNSKFNAINYFGTKKITWITNKHKWFTFEKDLIR